MSIITEAMRKAALKRIRSSDESAAETSRRPQRSSPRLAESVDLEAAARRFQHATIDDDSSSKLILPQLTDRSARRAYKILRTRVLQRLESKQWRSLAVTGTGGAGAGKTLTAVNLALALAQDPNTWVFLVDLDLQRPKVAPTLGLPVKKGLTDYLVGSATFDEVVYSCGIERLAIVPNARPVEQSSELLSSTRMLEFMHALENERPRRIIIYDVPPLLVSDDVLVVAPQIESLLLVATQGITPRATLAQAQEVLEEMNLLGVVLNRSSERDDSPYY